MLREKELEHQRLLEFKKAKLLASNQNNGHGDSKLIGRKSSIKMFLKKKINSYDGPNEFAWTLEAG